MSGRLFSIPSLAGFSSALHETNTRFRELFFSKRVQTHFDETVDLTDISGLWLEPDWFGGKTVDF